MSSLLSCIFLFLCFFQSAHSVLALPPGSRDAAHYQSRMRNIVTSSQEAHAYLSTPSCEWVRGSTCFIDDLKSFYPFLGSAVNLTALPVPAYQQFYDYTCGPSAIMNIMHYWGYLPSSYLNVTTELTIANEMGANEAVGTELYQIEMWLRNRGWHTQVGCNGTVALLQQTLQAGIPLLVEWVDWGGHYVVISGYNRVGADYTADEDMLFLSDSAAMYNNVPSLNGLTIINPDRFLSMWFDIAGLLGPVGAGGIVPGRYMIIQPPNVNQQEYIQLI